ncbi:MAG: hydrogenase maturation nickel metallochaperone HypA [Pirellulaceae bacterium]
MHELSLALNILDILQEQPACRAAAKVVAVHIQVGALSGVVKDALVSAYEIAREGTPYAGSRLKVTELPVRIRCAVCRREQPARSESLLCCAVCGEPATAITQGQELDVTHVEIEE